jgi:hypothetical protein
MPEGDACVDEGEAGFVLVVFCPAPDILPLEGLVALAPAQLPICEGCGKRADLAKGSEEDESGSMEVQHGWVLQAGCFGDGAVGGPVEDVQAVAGAVAPFGVGGDAGEPDGARWDGPLARLLFGRWVPEREWAAVVVAYFPYAVVERVDEQNMAEFADSGDESLLNVDDLYGVVE